MSTPIQTATSYDLISREFLIFQRVDRDRLRLLNTITTCCKHFSRFESEAMSPLEVAPPSHSFSSDIHETNTCFSSSSPLSAEAFHVASDALTVIVDMIMAFTTTEFLLFESMQKDLEQKDLLVARVLRILVCPRIEESELIIGLRIIQGLCLIHGRSKIYFQNSYGIKMVLTIVNNCSPQVRCVVLETLEAIIADCPANCRCLEAAGGLSIIAKVLTNRRTGDGPLMKCAEFFCLYLSPETVSSRQHSSSPAFIATTTTTTTTPTTASSSSIPPILTPKEKQQLLLPHVGEKFLTRLVSSMAKKKPLQQQHKLEPGLGQSDDRVGGKGGGEVVKAGKGGGFDNVSMVHGGHVKIDESALAAAAELPVLETRKRTGLAIIGNGPRGPSMISKKDDRNH